MRNPFPGSGSRHLSGEASFSATLFPSQGQGFKWWVNVSVPAFIFLVTTQIQKRHYLA